jgi:hypothetical protein
MRAFFAPELMPAIHTSSFDAAAAVRVPVPRETDLARGSRVTKAVRWASRRWSRGIDEAQRMVVEGVHRAGFSTDTLGEAIVLEFFRAVADKSGTAQLHGAARGNGDPVAGTSTISPDPPHPEVHGPRAGAGRRSSTGEPRRRARRSAGMIRRVEEYGEAGGA